MHKTAVVWTVLAVPSLAGAAPPITVGVTAGLTEARADADAGGTSSDTLGLFARLGITRRVAGQLELERIESSTPGVDIRTGTALLVVDLGSGGRLMPIMMAGIGFDDATDGFNDSTTGYHIEGGFGLEYRADGGLTIGGDLRMGGRSLDSPTVVLDALEPPITLRDGEYRSARLYAAVRF